MLVECTCSTVEFLCRETPGLLHHGNYRCLFAIKQCKQYKKDRQTDNWNLKHLVTTRYTMLKSQQKSLWLHRFCSYTHNSNYVKYPTIHHQSHYFTLSNPQVVISFCQFHGSWFTICGDACPLSCVNAEACLTDWPNAWILGGEEVVLRSLINEACVNVCCATVLSSELVGPACVQARSSNPRDRVCRPSGKGSGEEGILSDVVPVYIYCLAFSVSVSLGV